MGLSTWNKKIPKVSIVISRWEGLLAAVPPLGGIPSATGYGGRGACQHRHYASTYQPKDTHLYSNNFIGKIRCSNEGAKISI
ncbi:MAG: hypothetical protein R2795_00730 [Saprospiraceae bacterium]